MGLTPVPPKRTFNCVKAATRDLSTSRLLGRDSQRSMRESAGEREGEEAEEAEEAEEEVEPIPLTYLLES